MSALDIALWDIHGKHAGRTVAQLLGGYRDWSPTYITFGFLLFDHDQLVEYAHEFVNHGHTRFKMVAAVDPGGWHEDAKRIRVVRDAVGEYRTHDRCQLSFQPGGCPATVSRRREL